MHYIYVLIDSSGNFYTGYSENLKNRIKEHKKGLVYATKSIKKFSERIKASGPLKRWSEALDLKKLEFCRIIKLNTDLKPVF